MSEYGFTPGSWEAVTDGNVPYVTADASPAGDICDLYHKNEDGEFVWKHNAKANAFLISKAPEMVELLEALVGQIGCLIEDSEGVAGLHLNGAVADWDSLIVGEHDGWLDAYPKAQALLSSLKGGRDE